MWEFLFSAELISSFFFKLCQNFSFFFYFQPVFDILPWFHCFPPFFFFACGLSHLCLYSLYCTQHTTFSQIWQSLQTNCGITFCTPFNSNMWLSSLHRYVFSCRVCGLIVQQEDMPFDDRGICPDIVSTLWSCFYVGYSNVVDLLQLWRKFQLSLLIIS